MKTIINQKKFFRIWVFHMQACIKKWPAHKMKIDSKQCLLSIGASSLKVFLFKKSCRKFCQKPLLQCSVCAIPIKRLELNFCQNVFREFLAEVVVVVALKSQKVYSTHSPRSISRCNFKTSFYFLEEVIWLSSFHLQSKLLD